MATEKTDPHQDLKDRFVDTSGREASELPDGGRATQPNERPDKLYERNLPQQHGGEALDEDADDATGRSEGGLRGDRALGDARKTPGGGTNA